MRDHASVTDAESLTRRIDALMFEIEQVNGSAPTRQRASPARGLRRLTGPSVGEGARQSVRTVQADRIGGLVGKRGPTASATGRHALTTPRTVFPPENRSRLRPTRGLSRTCRSYRSAAGAACPARASTLGAAAGLVRFRRARRPSMLRASTPAEKAIAA